MLFDGLQAYWLGSADGSESVLTVNSIESDIRGNYCYRNNNNGVRPVIEIPTSLLQ